MSAYGVICPMHGPVDIGAVEYVRQMNRPNDRWRCPLCREISNFDDEKYEKEMGIAEEEGA